MKRNADILDNVECLKHGFWLQMCGKSRSSAVQYRCFCAVLCQYIWRKTSSKVSCPSWRTSSWDRQRVCEPQDESVSGRPGGRNLFLARQVTTAWGYWSTQFARFAKEGKVKVRVKCFWNYAEIGKNGSLHYITRLHLIYLRKSIQYQNISILL